MKRGHGWLGRKPPSMTAPTLRMSKSRLAFIQGNRAALDQVFNGEAHVPDRVVVQRERYEAQQGHFRSSDRWRLQASKLFSHPVDMSRGLISSALENAEAGRLVQAHKIEDRMLQSDLERGDRMVLALSLEIGRASC